MGMLKDKQEREAVDALFAEPEALIIAGQRVTVAPFEFGVSLRVLQIAGPLLREASEHGAQGGITADVLLDLMTRHAPAVVPMCALASAASEQWVASLEPEDGLRLFGAALKANADFFQGLVLQISRSWAQAARGRGKTSDSTPKNAASESATAS